MTHLISAFATACPSYTDDLWLVDSTPVECGRSRETVKRSDLAGWAGYGYCASHSRFFWGLRLHLITTPSGLPVAFALTNPKVDERDVAADMVAIDPRLHRPAGVEGWSDGFDRGVGEPDHEGARALLADAHEQMGYQAEADPWRNFYLTAAQDLRGEGERGGSAAFGAPVAILRAMPVSMILDSLAVRLNGPRADGRTLSIGWDLPDLDERWTVGVKHGAIHSHPGIDGTDATVTIAKRDLAELLAGVADIAALLESGALRSDGDMAALRDLLGLLDQPDFGFPIVTP